MRYINYLIILSLIQLLLFSCGIQRKESVQEETTHVINADSLAKTKNLSARSKAELQVLKETYWMESSVILSDKMVDERMEFIIILPEADTMSRDDLKDYCYWFRDQNCDGECTIEVYSTGEDFELYSKSPLTDEEYLIVADRFAATLVYTGYFGFYPFQDMRYDELGGKNWRK